MLNPTHTKKMNKEEKIKFLNLAYPVCDRCFGAKIVKEPTVKKALNKQREIYQKQMYSHRMTRICACQESEIL